MKIIILQKFCKVNEIYYFFAKAHFLHDKLNFRQFFKLKLKRISARPVKKVLFCFTGETLGRFVYTCALIQMHVDTCTYHVIQLLCVGKLNFTMNH